MVREGSLSINTEGMIIRFGYGLEFMLGYSAEETIGRPVTSFVPVERQAEFNGLLTVAKSSSAVTGHRVTLVQKGGSTAEFFISIYPFRNLSGEIYSLMVTLSIQKTTAVPAILTEEFQRIFKFSNDAVAITDKAGNIIDVNQSFLNTYGYERSEVIGRNPRVLKSRHSTKELYERMWKDILDPARGYWKGEIINVAKDGTEVPVLLSINAIKDTDGEIRNFLGIAFDMTRQKELDRLNRMYIDFIVHDMRNPLTSIIANVDLLLLQLKDSIPEKSRKRLDQIQTLSHRISAMTSDMLDYSRAQRGGVQARKERVGLAMVLNGAIQSFENTGKKLYVNRRPYGEAPLEDREINADADKLQRIIYNLLSNAFKHASAEVRVSTEFTASSVRVAVSDDGTGLTDEEAGRMFEAFYQTNEGIKAGGAGLGLSIVKSFVEAHGGSVWVEPSKGSGATLGFSIPA